MNWPVDAFDARSAILFPRLRRQPIRASRSWRIQNYPHPRLHRRNLHQLEFEQQCPRRSKDRGNGVEWMMTTRRNDPEKKGEIMVKMMRNAPGRKGGIMMTRTNGPGRKGEMKTTRMKK